MKEFRFYSRKFKQSWPKCSKTYKSVDPHQPTLSLELQLNHHLQSDFKKSFKPHQGTSHAACPGFVSQTHSRVATWQRRHFKRPGVSVCRSESFCGMERRAAPCNPTGFLSVTGWEGGVGFSRSREGVPRWDGKGALWGAGRGLLEGGDGKAPLPILVAHHSTLTIFPIFKKFPKAAETLRDLSSYG